MHIQVGRIADGVHEVDDELAHLHRREMPNPGTHLRKGEHDSASALVTADQRGEQARGDVGGLFTLLPEEATLLIESVPPSRRRRR
ncbi:hypothetical protein [Actinoallomurus sp. NPDC050550]|uniref:hypothetical protein n=1 Tax=Actinoallomurus sp. NPDC050550 TaxID=3154937 RepID=UPI003405EC78